jgi:hypothetical protein
LRPALRARRNAPSSFGPSATRDASETILPAIYFGGHAAYMGRIFPRKVAAPFPALSLTPRCVPAATTLDEVEHGA